jgi:acetyl-CoA carboxylase carboxyltransferase component
MKNTIATFVAMSFLIGCSCHAGSVKAQSPDENVVKGEYLVVIDNTIINMDTAKQKMMDELGKCEIKKLSSSIAHIIFDKDPGFDKVKEELNELKWIKSVEQNKVSAKISK